MFENLSYIPGLHDQYSTELSAIEAAAERAADQVQRERAKLLRPDGSAVFLPQEHAEREAAMFETAATTFDGAVSRYLARAEQDAAEAETKLAMLEGSDPYDRLSDAEKQAASTRAPFVKEDVDRLPPPELVKQARAAIASGDRARTYLLNRYLGLRIEAQRGRPGALDPEVIAVTRELAAVFDDGDRASTRRELEAKARRAKAVPIAVTIARRSVDGSGERMMDGMRQSLQALI